MKYILTREFTTTDTQEGANKFNWVRLDAVIEEVCEYTNALDCLAKLGRVASFTLVTFGFILFHVIKFLALKLSFNFCKNINSCDDCGCKV